MARRLVLVILSIALVVVAPGVALGKPLHHVTFSDTFDAFDGASWQPLFFSWDGSLHPSTGSPDLTGGSLVLRPSSNRGAVVLQTRAPVVTSLPAHVQWTVRYPGGDYRATDVALVKSTATDGSLSETRVFVRLGSVGGGYAQTYMTVYRGDALIGSTAPAATVIPGDTWLTGNLWIDRDHAAWSFNGKSGTVRQDMTSVLRDAGGKLYLLFSDFDDYGERGMEIDSVRVFQHEQHPRKSETAKAVPAAASRSARNR